MRKMLAFVLTIGLLAGLVSISPVSGSVAPVFSDISNHWAEDSIVQAVSKGYVSGYPDGTFQPNKLVSRAEFIKMLTDALKILHFEKGDPWYQPYVASVIEAGIHNINDYNTEYNNELSRLELVKLAIRATDVTYQTGKIVEDPNLMVYEATQKGILHGAGVGILDLSGTTTRAQAVAIIERILSVNSGQTLPVDKYAVASAELLWHRTNIFTTMPEYFDVNLNPDYAGLKDIKLSENKIFTLKDRFTLQNDNYSAEITEFLAINLGDPKDPNRKLLPALDKMQFDYGYLNPMPADAYVLIAKYHVNYNKKPTTYHGSMQFDIRGFEASNDEAVKSRKLMRSSGFVSLDSKFKHLNTLEVDMNGNGYIVKVLPGSGYTFKDSSLTFSAFASTYPGSPLGDMLSKYVLLAKVSNKIIFRKDVH